MLYFRERVLRVARAETGIPIFIASIFDATEIWGKSDDAFIAERGQPVANLVCPKIVSKCRIVGMLFTDRGRESGDRV